MALAHSPHIVRDSLIRYHDAGNVKSYPGSGLTWTDIIGKGNDGTNGTGGNACSFESSEPKCFVFDASNNNGRIMGPPLYNSINEGSVEVWFQHNMSTTTAAGLGMLYFEGDDNGYGGNKEMHLGVLKSSGNLNFWIESGDSNDINISTTTAIPENTWTCATVTFSGLTGQVSGGSANGKNGRIYINGISNIAQYQAGNYGGGANPSNSFIGRSKTQIDGKYRGLVGKVAVVKCYGKKLSDSEVLQNYHALKGRFGL
tara:strand:+ start:2490 stop:3260 length:771 start_codon:yes stop_codon:yes gene_type:complete